MGGGYYGGQWGGGGGEGGITNVVLYDRLEPCNKIQVYHATMLSF